MHTKNRPSGISFAFVMFMFLGVSRQAKLKHNEALAACIFLSCAEAQHVPWCVPTPMNLLGILPCRKQAASHAAVAHCLPCSFRIFRQRVYHLSSEKCHDSFVPRRRVDFCIARRFFSWSSNIALGRDAVARGCRGLRP